MRSKEEYAKVFLYGLAFLAFILLPFLSRAFAEILLAQEQERSIIYLRFAIAPPVGAIHLLQTKALQLHIDEATCALGLPNALVGQETSRPNEGKR